MYKNILFQVGALTACAALASS
jgi:triacylglycerol lipase